MNSFSYRCEATKYHIMSEKLRKKSEAISGRKSHYRRFPSNDKLVDKRVHIFQMGKSSKSDDRFDRSTLSEKSSTTSAAHINFKGMSRSTSASTSPSGKIVLPCSGLNKTRSEPFNTTSTEFTKTNRKEPETVSVIIKKNVSAFEEKKRKQKELADKFRALGY